ncbi:MAG: DUF2063 domain-containing protein [Beggiatoa sp. IS2]|nr:MAG: DUF2063 domain-containing protein [Beggiatoa sp. IS2]
MELETLQQLFYDALFEKDERASEQICQQIVSTADLGAMDRLAIYRSSVIGKLSRTLGRIYPVGQRLVGAEFFKTITADYIHHYPSVSPNLGDYGEQFAHFIAQSPTVAILPYLADVLRLEWHWHKIFTGIDSLPFDFKALAIISPTQWSEIIFRLPPTFALLESAYPIHRIWAVNQPDYQGEPLVHLEEGGVKMFLWRKEYAMRLEFVTEEEWLLLHQFQENKKFAMVCEELAHTDLNIPVLLQQFVQRGWINGFSIEQ